MSLRAAAAAAASAPRALVARLARAAAPAAAAVGSRAPAAARFALPAAARRAAAAAPLPLSRALPAAAAAAADEAMEVQLKVTGMVCDGCSSRVQAVLEKQAGVRAVAVDLASGLCTVSVSAATAFEAMEALGGLCTAVAELGFAAEPHLE